jgi:metal-responsive CopG/Arc/MetJ family transcriptional regulator
MEITTKTKRIDITLPIKTIEQIDDIWRKYGFTSRSSFLEHAAKNLAVHLKKTSLKKKLKAGYLLRAQRDVAMNRELEILDSEPV